MSCRQEPTPISPEASSPRRARRSRTVRRAPLLIGVLSVLLLPHARSIAAAERRSMPEQSRPAIAWSASLDSEVSANLDGGITTGGASDHLFSAGVRLDGAALGLPAGSALQATFIRTQSGDLSGTRVGDAQGVSNIAAPSRSRLYEAWYRQRLAGDRWSIQLGIIPADDYFDVTDSAGTLLNSSFGTQPSLAGNSIAPIYPTAGVGAIVSFRKGEWLNRTGVFQADPVDRSSALRRGALVLNELTRRASSHGTYKLGVWGYGPHAVDPFEGERPVIKPATWGAYLSAEYSLNADRSDGPTAFLRIGASPTASSTVPLDVEAGLLIPAPFRGRPADQLSLGITSARLRRLGVETVYEATYRFAITRHVCLQPDLQYVDNPGGAYPSATVLSMRLHIDLD